MLNFKSVVLMLFALVAFTACQDEVIDITPTNDQEVLQSNSPLTDLMTQTTANSGSYDDFLDNASCFSIELPVTINAGGITIIIEDVQALEDLEDFLEEFEDDDLDFVFPITITFNDYSEITINSEDELEDLIDDCGEDVDDDVIDCVDFVYPISFSVFNTDFDVIDTVVIENDEAFYNFLDDVEDDDEAFIVSLNYPVTLVYGNGTTIEVNSNEELEDAIDLVSEDCGDYDDDYEDCDEEGLEAQLTQCLWEIDDLFNDFDDLFINFNEDGTLQITGESNTQVIVEGNWDINSTDQGLVLILTDLSDFQEGLEGEWLIVDCDDDELELVNGDVIFELEQECDDDDDIFECFLSFDPILEICDEGTDGPYVVNLTEVFANCDADGISYFESYEDAENFVNLISNPTAYAVIGSETTLYVRIEIENEFVIVEFGIFIEDCENDSPFDCYDEEGYELEECDDNNDGIAVFNIYEAIPSCESTVSTIVSFHTTLQGAESNTDILEGATAYTNMSNPQTVYIRVTLFDNQEIFEVYPVELIVSDCDNGDCSESGISDYLQTCEWVPVSYNGDDHLIGYTMNFGTQEVSIEGDGMVATTTYSVQGTNPTFVFFDGINLPEIQVLTGDWTVTSCEADRIELQRNDDILVLEQDCD